tara:strand:+ start:10767 stop:12311 length:1545 start_codon:yes stop_codon:yes gene_type:complete
MDDTLDSALASLRLEADLFRKALVSRGFIDDGKTLQGIVEWKHGGATHRATIAVQLTDRFPFAPPSVAIIDCGELEPTFHRETNGDLCLWTTEYSLEEVPWSDPDLFIKKVAGWFAATESGWPGDDDADLERYLKQDDETILIYNAEGITNSRFYRTQSSKNGVVRVIDQLKWMPSSNRKKQRGLRRREMNLCYVIDAGSVGHPIRNWEDLAVLTGCNLTEVLKLIQMGAVKYLLVKYGRNGNEAYLALGVNKQGNLIAYESADSSAQTRTLRAGENANILANKKVIVFGAGAIGSNVIGLLFRSGVRKIKIVDPERLRPGNVIRHLAGDEYVGQYKALAVKQELSRAGLSIEDIEVSGGRVQDPKELLSAIKSYDLVVDTTADNRASSMLSWASEQLDIRMISASIQREGGIARVDRFPLWEGESHLPAVPLIPGSTERYEQGCGSPVSLTPPSSVLRAASLATGVALDQLRMIPRNPEDSPTVIEVITPQSDSPYNRAGLLTVDDMEVEDAL